MYLAYTDEQTNNKLFQYLLGRQPSDGLMILDEHESLRQMMIFLDGRYIDKDVVLPDEEIQARWSKPKPVEIEKVLRRESLSDILQHYLVDNMTDVTVVGSIPQHIAQMIITQFEAAQFDPFRSTKQRAVKTPWEQSKIQQAISLTYEVYHRFESHYEQFVGKTERELRVALLDRAVQLGADREAFDAIVATGPNSAIPHHQSGEKRIGPGPLLIDMGYRVDGYCSDMTRSLRIEGATDQSREQFAELLAIVQSAQQQAKELVKPGTATAEIDAAARGLIERHGYGDYFTHSTGHGVGLDVHEYPAVSAKSPHQLDTGMAITIEPGVYLPGKMGVRWEDLVIVG